MPTTGINSFANERQLFKNQWGTELVLGTAVTPTFKMYGDLRLTRTRALADRNEFAGTFFPHYTAVRGGVVVTGTYAQALSYEDLPMLLRYSVQGGVSGVSDANATPGYTYTQKPTASRKDIDFATVETGYPGMPFTATGLHLPEFTISADIDAAEAAWMWNGTAMSLTKTLKTNALASTAATGGSTSTVVKTAAGWVVDAYAGAFVEMTGGTAGNIGQRREILSNTATQLNLAGYLPAAVANLDTFVIGPVFTTGLTDRTRETIEAPGTKFYLDTATIGTTEIPGRVVSWNVNYNLNATGKRFMDNVTGFSRFGFGATVVTGQVRIEGDDRDEYDAWVAGTAGKVRFRQTGTTIDSGAGTTKSATIDVYNVAWDALTEDDRENNVTFTLTFRGLVDTAQSTPIQFATKNKVAALP